MTAAFLILCIQLTQPAPPDKLAPEEQERLERLVLARPGMYRWKDAHGTLHVSTNLDELPPKLRRAHIDDLIRQELAAMARGESGQSGTQSQQPKAKPPPKTKPPKRRAETAGDPKRRTPKYWRLRSEQALAAVRSAEQAYLVAQKKIRHLDKHDRALSEREVQLRKKTVELLPGEHTIKAKFGRKTVQQTIELEAGARYNFGVDGRRRRAALKKIE